MLKEKKAFCTLSHPLLQVGIVFLVKLELVHWGSNSPMMSHAAQNQQNTSPVVTHSFAEDIGFWGVAITFGHTSYTPLNYW